ncbi:MAG: trimethylamine methyltransferase family protein [Roseovarius sp.]
MNRPDPTAAQPRRKRRRGRTAEPDTPPRSSRYRHLKNPFTPQTIFSDDEVANIHATALRVLEELGVKILLDEARDIFSAAGATVEEDMVFIGRDIVEAALETAPRSFTQNAANPERSVTYEPGALVFRPGAGCPNAADRQRGRRPGTLEAFRETIKLCQSFDVIHGFAPCVEPQDVPVHLRHYATMKAQLELGDKTMFLYSRGRAQVEQAFEMIRLGLDLSDEAFDTGIWAATNINTNSPRMLDQPMAQGIIDFARANQMLIITPFCLAGAMAPVTVAGALTLQHAEALMGITLAQLSRPGAPVTYGGFSSNVDMRSGSPAFGTPEHVKMQLGSGQLARLLGLPWRSAAGSASVTTDMQAMGENDMGLFGCLMSQATICVHGAGWLEGGLSFGYEKFINDLETVQSLAELCLPTDGTDAEIGFDALAEVQPGGHFFAAAHTMERYRDAFYTPLLASLENFGTWDAAGAADSPERATTIWQGVLDRFEPPAGGAERADRVQNFIDRCAAAGGAPMVD